MNASVITLAANVNDILSRYILIHDQIIKVFHSETHTHSRSVQGNPVLYARK